MMVVAGDEELLYRMLTEGIPFLQTQGEGIYIGCTKEDQGK